MFKNNIINNLFIQDILNFLTLYNKCIFFFFSASVFAITALYYSVLSIFLGVCIGWMTHFLLKWINSEGCGITYAVICFSYLVYAITLFCKYNCGYMSSN